MIARRSRNLRRIRRACRRETMAVLDPSFYGPLTEDDEGGVTLSTDGGTRALRVGVAGLGMAGGGILVGAGANSRG